MIFLSIVASALAFSSQVQLDAHPSSDGLVSHPDGSCCQEEASTSQEDSHARLVAQLESLDVHLITNLADSSIAWPPGVTGNPVSKEDLVAYSQIIMPEVGLYPRDVFRVAGLRRVVLCTDLKIDSRSSGGVSYVLSGAMYLNVSPEHFILYAKKTLHHEVFHFIDAVDECRTEASAFEDSAWTSLNAAGVGYAKPMFQRGVRSDVRGWRMTSNWPGFVTRFAMSDVGEDKAEVFSNMMVLPHWLKYLCEKDAVIKAKVDRMRQLLEQFSPHFNGEYFDGIDKRQEVARFVLAEADDALRNRTVEQY